MYVCMCVCVCVCVNMYLSFQIKDHFRLMRPTLKHSVTHNSISQDLLKRI